MIVVALREYDNRLVLSYELKFLNDKKIMKLSTGSILFELDFKPIVKLIWLKDYGSDTVKLLIEVHNDSKESMSNTELLFEDELHSRYIMGSLDETIMAHISELTNKRYLFEDQMRHKWPKMDMATFEERFGNSYLSKMLKTNINFSTVLKGEVIRKKWDVYSHQRVMERDIPLKSTVEKVRKF